ncbi:MAG: RNA polymerase sigma factor [Sedimentisphaerales bacterium]|nr:RNA polymerase sigma factor [Sedimentisphaerales bacterium]
MVDMSVQNESALACAAQQGDKEALQLLLKRNWGWLKGLVYSVLTDAQELDDVLQEVCLRVITRIHTLREPERFRAWLATVARREVLKHYRRRTHERIEVNPGTLSYKLDADTRDPLEDVERNELCGRILEAVKTLPEKYREVFVLAHTGELTYAEMAEVLDVPITTMQIRLSRARRMVQNQVTGKADIR